MKKCKICGQLFDYHITNAHLETHGITRKEYNAIKKDDNLFIMGRSKKTEHDIDADNYVIDAIKKSTKRRNA